MTAKKESRQQKEKTTENKKSRESYIRKSIICKENIYNFKKIIFNNNRLKAHKGLLNRSFEKTFDVVGG